MATSDGGLEALVLGFLFRRDYNRAFSAMLEDSGDPEVVSLSETLRTTGSVKFQSESAGRNLEEIFQLYRQAALVPTQAAASDAVPRALLAFNHRLESLTTEFRFIVGLARSHNVASPPFFGHRIGARALQIQRAVPTAPGDSNRNAVVIAVPQPLHTPAIAKPSGSGLVTVSASDGALAKSKRKALDPKPHKEPVSGASGIAPSIPLQLASLINKSRSGSGSHAEDPAASEFFPEGGRLDLAAVETPSPALTPLGSCQDFLGQEEMDFLLRDIEAQPSLMESLARLAPHPQPLPAATASRSLHTPPPPTTTPSNSGSGHKRPRDDSPADVLKKSRITVDLSLDEAICSVRNSPAKKSSDKPTSTSSSDKASSSRKRREDRILPELTPSPQKSSSHSRTNDSDDQRKRGSRRDESQHSSRAPASSRKPSHDRHEVSKPQKPSSGDKADKPMSQTAPRKKVAQEAAPEAQAAESLTMQITDSLGESDVDCELEDVGARLLRLEDQPEELDYEEEETPPPPPAPSAPQDAPHPAKPSRKPKEASRKARPEKRHSPVRVSDSLESGERRDDDEARPPSFHGAAAKGRTYRDRSSATRQSISPPERSEVRGQGRRKHRDSRSPRRGNSNAVPLHAGTVRDRLGGSRGWGGQATGRKQYVLQNMKR